VLKSYFMFDEHKWFGKPNDHHNVKWVVDDLDLAKKMYKSIPHLRGELIINNLLSELKWLYPTVFNAVAEIIIDSLNSKNEVEFTMRPPK